MVVIFIIFLFIEFFFCLDVYIEENFEFRWLNKSWDVLIIVKDEYLVELVFIDIEILIKYEVYVDGE